MFQNYCIGRILLAWPEPAQCSAVQDSDEIDSELFQTTQNNYFLAVRACAEFYCLWRCVVSSPCSWILFCQKSTCLFKFFSCFPPKVLRRYTIPLSCNAQPGNFFRTTAQIHFFREIMVSLKYCIISMLTLKELLLNRY